MHCALREKWSMQIRSFFWSVFTCIRTEYGDLLCIYSVTVFGHFSRSGDIPEHFHHVFDSGELILKFTLVWFLFLKHFEYKSCRHSCSETFWKIGAINVTTNNLEKKICKRVHFLVNCLAGFALINSCSNKWKTYFETPLELRISCVRNREFYSVTFVVRSQKTLMFLYPKTWKLIGKPPYHSLTFT